MKKFKVITIIIIVLILCCVGYFVNTSAKQQREVEQQVIESDIVSLSEGSIENQSQNLSENDAQDNNPEQEEENGVYYTMEDVKSLNIPEDMLAYWMVLNGKKPFVSYDMGGQKFYWNEFWGIRADQFMIVDMDNDGEKEVVLYCWPESTMILHYEDGSVYSYRFAFRGMKDIRTNGIYMGSGGASSGSYCRLTELNADGYVIETLVEYDFNGKIYEVNGKAASEDECLEMIDSINETELADQMDGAAGSYLLGTLTTEELSIVQNVPREEMSYPAASYPMDAEVMNAYHDVLMSGREFISTIDDNERYYLEDYYPREEYQPDESGVGSSLYRPDRIWYFSIVDMDGDGTYEVLLDGTYTREILSYLNGEVYSYEMNTGVISNSGIVCTSEYSQEYGRIVSFGDSEYVMETVDYNGDINNDRIQYYYFSEELIEQYFK